METDPRFAALTNAGVSPQVVSCLAELVAAAPDEALAAINPLELARKLGLDPGDTVDAFIHAANAGLFDMAWNVCCPGCGGVLDAGAQLKTFVKSAYPCSLCAASYEPTLDEIVAVTFSPNASLRRIAAHDPESLGFWEFYRQAYFGPGLALPGGTAWQEASRDFTLEEEVLQPGDRVVLTLQLPPEFLILFEPVTHSATFLDVEGEPTGERQDLTVTFTAAGATHTTVTPRPGPMRLTLENKTGRRLLPGVFRGNESFHDIMTKRRPTLTAKQVLTNQVFRNLFKADTLDIDQRLKIASLTVLFTDLKGSTELYERVGDLLAYDIVRSHFQVLNDVVRDHDGAVVKTIGDAVMATFATPTDGIRAALSMHSAMSRFNAAAAREELVVKIGLHEGPALVVTVNDRIDYFGQTVNIASRVQGLATAQSLFTTRQVVTNPGVQDVLAAAQLSAVSHQANLKGIRDELTVYEIPLR